MDNSYQLKKLEGFDLVEVISNPKTPCHIKQKAIRTLRNIIYKDRQLAWKIIEKLLPVLETFIIHPRDNDLQREALWLLGYVRNHLSIGIIENLIASPQTPPLLKEKALRVLGFSISRGSKLAAQAVERLLPILESLIVSTQTLDGLKKMAIKTLVKGLPLKVDSPKVEFPKESYNFVSIDDILSKVRSPHNPRFISRSLVYDLNDNNILVIKILKEKQHPSSLLREGYWIKYLNKLKTEGHFTDVRFDIPQLLEFCGGYVIKLTNIPIRIPKEIKLHPDKYAICFVISKEYFCYPNETQPEKVLSWQEIKEVMARCAYLLGYLTSLGIIHTEVIPLFHNRIQIGRRFDRGLYRWQFKGRLDRWLVSCDWPNFGKTGIRDFEHIISWGEKPPVGYQDRSGVYRFIGNHLLSLFLVTGSYFRNRKREMTGWDHKGNPVDARNLFNKSLFKEIIRAILLSYYKGFVGKEYLEKFPFDLDNLIQRAIEEMGVDRHMEERLRIEDQQRMSDEEFKEFLITKGYSGEEIKRFVKGKEDIILLSGPHLGGFNELISLPEMIDVITIWAALCIIGKYKNGF